MRRRWLPRLRLNRTGFRATVYGLRSNHSFYATWAVGYQKAKRDQSENSHTI
jgi:hypothetical protein